MPTVHDSDGDDEERARNHESDDVDRARRKLLRVMVYAAPAIVSTVVVERAHAQVSCPPANCSPASCPPSACPPNGGCPPILPR